MKVLRNPLLELPGAQELLAMPRECRQLVARLLADLALESDRKAEEAWARRKGPMAAYWRASSTYAKHLARLLGGRVPRRAGASRRST